MHTVNTARVESPASNLPWDYPNPFIQPIRPSTQDIDGLEHTNNAIYVQWCESIAWAHSASFGLDLQAYRRLDRAMAIREARYEYLLASNLGDELLIGTWLVGSDRRLTLQRRFQIIRPRDNAIILRGHWELVCIEISSGRARRMPEEFCKAYLEALVPEPDTGI
jgi:acyl-CoA thioester hydrolase